MNPQETRRISVTAIARAGGVIQSRSVVEYEASLRSSIAVVQADVQITRDVPREIPRGVAFTVYYTVRNVGNGMARNVLISEPLPVGLTTIENQSSVSILVGNLRPNDDQRFQRELIALGEGPFDIQAQVTVGGAVHDHRLTTSPAYPWLEDSER